MPKLTALFVPFVLAIVVMTTLLTPGSAMAQPPASPAPIDVGVATLEELVRLPGVGETRARAILAARAARPFRRVQDLLRVPGIGRKTLSRLLPYVTVGPPARRTP